jgi:hypothetical protein
MCSIIDTNGNIGACCSNDPTCCKGNLIAIPVATSAWHPPQASATTGTTTGAASGTSTQSMLSSAFATTSVGSLVTSPAAESSSAGQAAAGDGSSATTKIALGVGIPVGLAVAGALFFLGWQVRKRKAAPPVAYPGTPQVSQKHELGAANSSKQGWGVHELSQEPPRDRRYEMDG